MVMEVRVTTTAILSFSEEQQSRTFLQKEIMIYSATVLYLLMYKTRQPSIYSVPFPKTHETLIVKQNSNKSLQ